jgi:hypothetical protein
MASAPSVTPDAIFQLAQGFMASKLFFTAGEIDLFAQLADGPKSQADLAAGLKLPVRSVGVVANAMVALGMLTFENGRYGNTEVAQVFLTGRGHDMRPLVRFWNRLSYPSWNGLVESVRKDGKKDAVFDFSPEDQALFSAGVEAASAGGGMALAASYDFSKRARVLDIGGGTGSFLKFIHRAHPRVGLALFELPGTAGYARSRFSPEDAAAITTIDGDMLKDALPGGYDVLLMAHLLHCCNVEENLGLLKRAHSSAPPGAQLLAVDFFLNETKTGPLPGALMSGEFLTQTSGISYSAAEVREWGTETGWRFVEQRPLAGPVSLLVLEK